jgi:four helix bundle protein
MVANQTSIEKQAALQERTKQFALASIRLSRSMRVSFEGRHIAGQFLRSSTSVAANYRATCRSRSRREFVARLGVVVEEGDEALFWLDLAKGANLVSGEGFNRLRQEANELVAIFTAARSTAEKGLQSKPKSLNH